MELTLAGSTGNGYSPAVPLKNWKGLSMVSRPFLPWRSKPFTGEEFPTMKRVRSLKCKAEEQLHLFLRLLSLKFQSPERIFTEIYRTNGWNGEESLSGKGSDLQQTRELVRELPKLLKAYEIQSILDIPCGDFHWMRQVDLRGCHYIGGDIVMSLIESNQAKYQSEHVEFRHLDIITSPLPNADLVHSRDCFIHLSFQHIFKSLKNIAATQSKYLAISDYPAAQRNKDIPTGHWRELNFKLPPFNFPEPLEVIDEKSTETGTPALKSKRLALWRLEDLRPILPG
jgi:SAM-dependent methyltransferase